MYSDNISLNWKKKCKPSKYDKLLTSCTYSYGIPSIEDKMQLINNVFYQL